MWLVTRYSDVSALLKDRHASKGITCVVPQEKLGSGLKTRDLLGSHPPDHTRLRALVYQAFTPKQIRDLEPHITRKPRSIRCPSHWRSYSACSR